MTTRTVTGGNVAALMTALDQSAEGDVIEVAGDFPTNLLVGGTRFTVPGAGVIIRPVEGEDHSFAGALFQSLNGIHLRGLRFRGCLSLAAVTACSVKFCRIGGDPMTPDQIRALDTKAMDLKKCNRVDIVGNEIAYVGTGFSFMDCDNLTFLLNDTHHFRADAYRGYSSLLTISRNIVTDLFRNGDEHVDAIQLWTTNVAAADAPHDVIVEDNWLERGGGDPAQGIFLANERHLPNRDFRVAGNLSAMGQWNAVFVDEVVGVELENNTVVGWKGALSNNQQMKPWIKTDGSTDVDQSGNRVMPLVDFGALDAATACIRARRQAELAQLMAA